MVITIILIIIIIMWSSSAIIDGSFCRSVIEEREPSNGEKKIISRTQLRSLPTFNVIAIIIIRSELSISPIFSNCFRECHKKVFIRIRAWSSLNCQYCPYFQIVFHTILIPTDGDVPWAMLTLRTVSRKHLLEKQRLNISKTLCFSSSPTNTNRQTNKYKKRRQTNTKNGQCLGSICWKNNDWTFQKHSSSPHLPHYQIFGKIQIQKRMQILTMIEHFKNTPPLLISHTTIG